MFRFDEKKANGGSPGEGEEPSAFVLSTEERQGEKESIGEKQKTVDFYQLLRIGK